MCARHEQLLRREACNDLAAIFRHHQLLLDASGCPAIGGWPEGLQGENHALLDDLRVIQRDESAKDRLLPNREPYSMPVLQGKGSLLIGKAELWSLGPELDDIRRRYTRLDGIDGGIQDVAALF